MTRLNPKNVERDYFMPEQFLSEVDESAQGMRSGMELASSRSEGGGSFLMFRLGGSNRLYMCRECLGLSTA